MNTVHEFGRFFLPGPTDIRAEILAAQAGPPLPHRGAAFERLFASLQPGLRQVFGTARPVYVSTSSATGLMEAAVRCAKPGPILSLVNGAFAERFADIARSCGRDVTVLDAPWGRTVPLEQVEQALRARAYAGVTVVHSETSTGALTPLSEFGALCRTHGALSLVDSVTGVAGAAMQADAWQLDFVFTGSQKALAMPPGLAFGVASERYLATAHEAPARGRYFDVLEFEQYIHKHQTPNTPAVSLLYAAAAQLAYIEQETIAVRVQRHRAMAERTQAWVADTRASLGVPLCLQALEGERSPTVTCIALPLHIAGDAVVKGAAARGFVIGGGYGKLKATHIRIGHMGDHTLNGLEHCLAVVHDSIAERIR
jgi:aspartate aminotransferase-like enzyme